jgi:hypothetical protein
MPAMILASQLDLATYLAVSLRCIDAKKNVCTHGHLAVKGTTKLDLSQ